MKYAVIREDGVTEIREDDHTLQDGAFVLDDQQYDQLMSGQYILQNGQIVTNPNPPRTI